MNFPSIHLFRHVLALLIVFSFGTTHALANDHLNPPPKEVLETLKDAKRMGSGTLRWFGLRIYDGQLWSAVDSKTYDYKRDPAWLELKYARDFDGKDIAERTIDEMQEIGAGTEVQRQGWEVKLASIFPNVKKGHTLSALFIPGKGVQFFRNGLPLAKVDDPEMAEAFMGIWLDPKTTAPEMRRELIGLSK
jgi:hypothetical protein